MWGSAFVVWVAIPFSDITSFIEKIEQGICNALGSLSAIFAHPDECGPVPWTKKGKKDEAAAGIGRLAR